MDKSITIQDLLTNINTTIGALVSTCDELESVVEPIMRVGVEGGKQACMTKIPPEWASPIDKELREIDAKLFRLTLRLTRITNTIHL